MHRIYPATITSISRRSRPACGSRGVACRRRAGAPCGDAGAGAMWVCEDHVMGRSGMPANREAVKAFSAMGGPDRRRRLPRRRPAAPPPRHGPRRPAASVIYGPLSLGFPIEDPALQETCYAAWNDWAVEEFNATAPDRLCVLAFLPGHSPDAAAAELERCAALGHRGAIIGAFDIDLGDRAGTGSGRPRKPPGCRSAFTSRAARRRS